jgi:signal transduction histidine kinase
MDKVVELLNLTEPFNVFFDKSLKILSFGPAMRKVIGGNQEGKEFNHLFSIKRPITIKEPSFDWIQKSLSLVFILELNTNIGLCFKGEFKVYEDKLLFVGSPFISEIAQLKNYGLTISDFPVSDSIIDILLLNDMEKQTSKEMKELITELIGVNSALSLTRLELIKANQALNQQYEREKQSYKSLDETFKDFTFSVSHDLKAPVRQVSMFVEIFMDRLKQLSVEDDKLTKFANFISLNSTRALNMIDGLYSLTKSTGKKIDLTTIEIVPFLEEIIASQNPDDKYNFEIGHDSQTAAIKSDKVLLDIIMSNLISNAIKYSKNLDNPKVSINVNQKEDCWLIIIADNGVGFNMSHGNQLFKMFSRLHGEDSFDGLGIGLMNVKMALDKLQGTIEFESSVNNGTTFTIKLPFHSNYTVSHQQELVNF